MNAVAEQIHGLIISNSSESKLCLGEKLNYFGIAQPIYKSIYWRLETSKRPP